VRSHDGEFLAHAIQLVTTSGPYVTRILSFNDDRLLARFGLPREQPAATDAGCRS